MDEADKETVKWTFVMCLIAQCLSALLISEGIPYRMSLSAGRIPPSTPHGG